MNDYDVNPLPGVSGSWPVIPNPLGTWPLTMRDSSNLWVVPQCAEKPHETITRALSEVARAARDMVESAQAVGVPFDKETMLDALTGRLRDEMKD